MCCHQVVTDGDIFTFNWKTFLLITIPYTLSSPNSVIFTAALIMQLSLKPLAEKEMERLWSDTTLMIVFSSVNWNLLDSGNEIHPYQ
ncbi:unnamed protein product [Brugia pahangi]|uniref:Neur_chan_memb domain-containing protein n=1 Tax=Brugia pahangi TaxID=6280 RepID=A0A0N4TDL5_BRUPA|nr:unnamed protein product [Brugia pahangi]